MEENFMDQLLRASEAAKVLAVKESTIRKWLHLKKIPMVKLGGATRIRQADVASLARNGFQFPNPTTRPNHDR